MFLVLLLLKISEIVATGPAKVVSFTLVVPRQVGFNALKE